MRIENKSQLSCRGEGLLSNKPFKPLDLDQIKALLLVVNDDISVIEEEIKKGKESQS